MVNRKELRMLSTETTTTTLAGQSEPDVPVSIASAGTEDLDVIIPMVREFYDCFGYPYAEGQKRDVLQGLMRDESLGRLMLIKRDGIHIGYVLVAFSFSLEFNGPIAFIDELFIIQSARGMGVGSAVLKQVESLCFDGGMKAVRLESEACNKGATALYLRSGYVDCGRHLLTKKSG